MMKYPHHKQRPVVYPTRQCARDFFRHQYVPHIHPSHMTNRYHDIIHHQHYYPHTESNVCDTQHVTEQCGRPYPC